MDCLDVQQLFSQAMDHEEVDQGRLDEARRHCHECAQCMTFVQGLAVLHRYEPPREPDDLVARVMTAVSEEAERSAEREATGSKRDTDLTGEREQVLVPGKPAPLRARLGRRMSPTAAGAWIGAAAAVLVLATFAAVAGIRSIVNAPPTESQPTLEREAAQAPPSGYDQNAGTASDSAKSLEDQGTETLPRPEMIAIDGFAYRLLGTVTVDRATLTTLTTTVSSLDLEETPQSRTVYRMKDGKSLAVIRGDETLAFEMVRRTYDGRMYALRCDSLPTFETWPTLPSNIPEPTTRSGAPVFVSAGPDSLGVEVYRLPTAPATEGIGVPPDQSPSDPTRGNPSWTWWTPSP